MLEVLANLFPLWVTLGSLLALWHPPLFTWFSGSLITWGLAVIMLGMGMTLNFADFKKIFEIPRTIAIGAVSQFTIMPLLGFSLAMAFQLPPDMAAGLILVSCCPGGTASNVVCYIARANVALSVVMTMTSTFLAVFLTPLLTGLLASHYVDVDELAMLLQAAQVVLIPVLLGMLMHQFLPRVVERVVPAAPLVAVVAIVLIVGSIIGKKAEEIQNFAAALLTAVFLLHMGGFLLGYLSGKIFGYEAQIRRTLAIEVGMQNSGLGAALANSQPPHVIINSAPCALSALFHCILGSVFASYWRFQDPHGAEGNSDELPSEGERSE